MVENSNHTSRRSYLKKATVVATATGLAGCSGGKKQQTGSSGGSGGKTTPKSTASKLDTFKNDIGKPVGANWEAVQELAKEEGELKITASVDTQDFETWMSGFPAEWKGDIEYVTGDGTKLAVKDIQSYKAGRPETSMSVANSGIIAWQQEDLAMELSSDYLPMYGEVEDKYKTDYMLGQRLKCGALFYNTDMLSGAPDEIISSWMDFIQDDQWTGKLGWDPTPNWGLMGSFLKSFGEEFFDHLKARKPEWVDSHTDLARFTAAGKFPIAHTYADKVMDVSPEKAPIDVITNVPLPATASGSGITTFAPAPNRALVLANWISTKEGQKYMSKTHQSVSLGLEAFPASKDWPIGDVVVETKWTNKAKEIWLGKELGAGASGA